MRKKLSKYTVIPFNLHKSIKALSVLVYVARLCRLKKKAQAEANATSISNLLPFMEYEVHTQLMNKLKLRGMNALFGLRIQITVGENMLMGLAVSTVGILGFFCFLTVFQEGHADVVGFGVTRHIETSF